VEQFKQLVGLVDYDASKDPFPVTGWDAIVFVVGNATQARTTTRARGGWS
jgi:4-hydroxyphenylpyruvate dioxygenase